MTLKQLAAAALASSVLVAAAGCGSGGASDSGASGGDGDLLQVKVGLVPATAVAPLYLGDEKGFFEEAGVDLEIVSGMGGPGAVAGVQSQSVDVAIAAPDTLVTSRSQGIELTALATAGAVPPDGTGGNRVVVPADSDITGGEGLEGMTIGVFGLKGLNDIAIMAAMDAEGADSSTVQFVNLDYPAMLGALERGDIDAAALAEPFLSQAVNAGEARVAFDFWPISDPDGATLTLWFTGAEQLAIKDEEIQRFTTAMLRSSEYADANPDEVRAILPTMTQMTAEQAAETELQSFSRDLVTEDFEQSAERLSTYADLENEPDLDGIVYEPDAG